jgi:uncharacterized protein (DUF885 family)
MQSLAADYWDLYLEQHPVEATTLGYRGHDARLPDVTPRGRRAARLRLERVRSRLTRLSPDDLSAPDQVTWRALRSELEGQLTLLDCDLDAWTLDPLDGPQVMLLKIAKLQTVETPQQGRDLVARYCAMGPYLRHRAERLRAALEDGRVAPRCAAERFSRQIAALLATPVADRELLEPLCEPHGSWSGEDLGGFRRDLQAAVQEQVIPGFRELGRVVARVILPAARPDHAAGIGHLPGGPDCYRRLIRRHTGLDLSPQEIHHRGLQEVERLRERLQDLGRQALGTDGLGETLRRLRGDASLYFHSREEVLAQATTALALARDALPRMVGRLPRTDCVVRAVEAYEEQDSTIAYYQEPAADGSRAGTYFINTFAPDTRPRYEAQALAFHESIPGHHVQIALAQERDDLPEFRRHLGSTAFVEGWALYTEGLADEMSLYSSQLDRVGMLSFDAWRASRLVVDTGVHALGWSRQQAVEYLRANTALAEGNIQNEVDRYIVWPGQALAYKIGQQQILSLRQEAARRLGPAFDLREFHDRLLANGAVSLEELGRQVASWIEERK